MIHFKKLFLALLFFSLGFICCTQKNLLEFNFNALPEEIKVEILDYVFVDYKLELMSIKELENILDLRLVNKKYKEIIDVNYLNNDKNFKFGDKLNYLRTIIKQKNKVLIADLIDIVKASGLNNKDEKLKKIKELLITGIDINQVGKSGNTVLMEASQEGLKEIVELLINLYSKKYNKIRLKDYINIKNYDGNTAYSLVCENKFDNYKDICEILVNSGAEIITFKSKKRVFWMPNY